MRTSNLTLPKDAVRDSSTERTSAGRVFPKCVMNSDLLRLSKSKKEVDLSPNTIRAYAQNGLNLYRAGKAVFYSRSELESFIKSQPPQAFVKKFVKEQADIRRASVVQLLRAKNSALLGACKAALGQMDPAGDLSEGELDFDVCQQLKTAITKAEGEA